MNTKTVVKYALVSPTHGNIVRDFGIHEDLLVKYLTEFKPQHAVPKKITVTTVTEDYVLEQAD
ncbi:hypothetical protein C121_22 [Stenotrophomonas phage C121]|uniref:hypothetical protein n=1 Tax=Stenotrophomonas phage C121 TaxID=2914029 RepID=UPI0023292D85|nr:hypothetical protein PP752_gp22 [Stenotrophomonas phage C121]UKL14755.1 hypothetical protein C121_22 [Stenotrophomonas phage C121]